MQNKVDWSKVLIRCSSLGQLMTEPKDKVEREAGELSKTAKTMLRNVYINEKYGREKETITKPMRKGIEVEEESITLLSRVMKRMLYKNTERLKNDFITGLPDIYDGKSIFEAETITDIKSPYDIFTFVGNIGEKLDSDYFFQLQGYMALSGAKKAYIAYCLVDAPASLIEAEKYRLLRSMDVISEESPEYIEKAIELERNMTFSDIPKEQRVLLFLVEKDENTIQRVYEKVKKARAHLQTFEEMHMNFNNKILK